MTKRLKPTDELRKEGLLRDEVHKELIEKIESFTAEEWSDFIDLALKLLNQPVC